MHFGFSDEQDDLRQTVRRFLVAHSPPAEVRRLMETAEGVDREVWSRLCGELGLGGVHVPEDYGGQGFGFAELCIVAEEAGRALLCAPYFSSVVLAASAIQNAATHEQKKALLPAIASGEVRATLAIAESAGVWDSSGVGLIARPTGDGAFALYGVKTFVIDGHCADRVVVVARRERSVEDDGISFFLVDGDAAGLTRRPLETLDPTRKQARLEFDGVRGELLGELGAGAPALAKTLAQAQVALANEMVGGAQKVLETTVEYAKVRVQFGRPIGSFQAIKHKLADMLLALEPAKSAAYYAAESAAQGDEALGEVASLAKALASDAYRDIAAESIQIHGGVGFTWESDCHLYFRRAKTCEVLLGDPTYHRERYMRYLEVS